MSGESVIKTANENVEQCTDPVTKFPIPCKRDLRKDRNKSRAATSSTSTASRYINFTGEGSEVTFATNFPFQPLSLHWNGTPGITTRQLQQKKEQMKKASQEI